MAQDLVPYEEFAHIADLGLRARGRNREELFANAALGMLSLMGCRTGEGAFAEIMIEIEGLDPEHLLVRWLSEILYLYREGKMASGIVFELLVNNNLKARCRLEKLPGSFIPKKEVKLVTHHGACIRERAGILEAEVVLDV